MSVENVEIIRRYFEAPSPIAVADYWDAEGDYYPVRKFPESRPCHGREEIERFLVEYNAAWEYGHVIKDVKPVGDDRVVVHAHIEAKGRASGMVLGGDIYYCYWLRHGLVIRQEDHLTAKGALHALGLNGETFEAAGLSD